MLTGGLILDFITTHGSLPQIVENKEMDEYHFTNMENQFFGGGDNSNNNFDDNIIGETYYHNEEEDATLVKLAEEMRIKA